LRFSAPGDSFSPGRKKERRQNEIEDNYKSGTKNAFQKLKLILDPCLPFSGESLVDLSGFWKYNKLLK